MKVHLAAIGQDRSPGKKVSHTKLLCLVQEVKADGLVSLYKKKELQLLCKGYGIASQSKWNKKLPKSSNKNTSHVMNRLLCIQLTLSVIQNLLTKFQF